jgi:hypothetical protein
MKIIGTNYFPGLWAAHRYYATYGESRAAVAEKIAKGEIHIGKPALKPGQKLKLIDCGQRWAIVEA